MLVDQKRKKEKVGRGNTFRDRRRGASRPDDQTVLPKLKRSKKGKVLRIPRTMINQHWLKGEYGIPYDSRELISGDESDGQGGSVSDNGGFREEMVGEDEVEQAGGVEGAGEVEDPGETEGAGEIEDTHEVESAGGIKDAGKVRGAGGVDASVEFAGKRGEGKGAEERGGDDDDELEYA